MEYSVIAATAGLAGSLLGGMSTFAASWLTTRAQHRTQTTVQQAAHRERLYADFIGEASRHLVRAWGHQLNRPQGLAGLYSLVERMRLTSSDAVIGAAESVIADIISAYSAPNRSYEELQRRVLAGDVDTPLTRFSRECRAELKQLTPAHVAR
ncbi:MAG: hypothetical protein JSR73_03955 [Proteobacteria bacterium]|nr:hypothetical protein [Pseudomonadota bacterium]